MLPALGALLESLAASGETLAGIVLGGVGGAVVAAGADPLRRWISYHFNSWFPNAELEPELLVRLYDRGIIDDQTYFANMKKYGYDETHALEFWYALREPLPLDALLEVYFRGWISTETYYRLASQLGYDPYATHLLYLSAWRLPSPDDIIEGVFRGYIRPEDYHTYMGKLRYTPADADYLLWLAYRLPSPNDVIEGVFRGFIGPYDYYRFMQMHHYTPADADYLLHLAWRIPSPDLAIRLWWKGVIDWSTLYGILQANHIDPYQGNLMLWDSAYVFSPAEAADLFIKGFFNWEQYVNECMKSGLTPEYAYAYLFTRQQLLPPGIIQEAVNRQFIDEQTGYYKLLQLGYTPEDAWTLLQLRWWFPPVGDIIRFGVREVFRDDIVRLYRTDEDFPEEIIPVCLQAGLNPEYMKWYWRAHWELPSVQMGYEMLHRGVITREELETLMRTQDIMPYWRDKLIQISYNPYTRVDVRRMYQAGVLTEEEVFRAYLDLGYDEEHAAKLTEWTIRTQMEDEKDLTKQELVAIYQSGAVDENWLYWALRDLGYSDYAAWWIVTLAIYRKNHEFVEQVKKIARNRFVNHIFNEQDVWAILSKAGLNPDEIYRLIDIWTLERQSNVEMPTKTDILNWYRYNIVGRHQAKDWLVRLGYPPDIADLYLIEIDTRYRRERPSA